MAIPIIESAILKPQDPSVINENNWPELRLTNVEVTETKGQHSNLLLASKAMPMTVTGNLDLDKKQQHFCELPSAKCPLHPTIARLLIHKPYN